MSAGSSFSKLEAANYLTGVLEYWSTATLGQQFVADLPIKTVNNSVVAYLEALTYLDPRRSLSRTWCGTRMTSDGRVSSFPQKRESR